MNGDKLKLWIDALRSGEYPQGTGQLNKTGKYCCLGVLCEVALKDGVKMEVRTTPTTVDGETETAYDGFGAFPPPAVRKWLEVDTAAIRVKYADDTAERTSVVRLNDTYRADFATIADALESTFLGVPA